MKNLPRLSWSRLRGYIFAMGNRTETGDIRQEIKESTYHEKQIVDITSLRPPLPAASCVESTKQGQPQMTSPKFAIDLQVISFHRGYDVHGAVKPYHWAILAMTSPGGKGTVYQLRGMPGNFKYEGPEDEAVLDLIENKQQELEIGRIPAAELKNLESLLEHIPVSQAEYGYNCQTWTENTFEIMESFGWLDYPCSAIVQWLKQLEGQDPSSGVALDIDNN